MSQLCKAVINRFIFGDSSTWTMSQITGKKRKLNKQGKDNSDSDYQPEQSSQKQDDSDSDYQPHPPPRKKARKTSTSKPKAAIKKRKQRGLTKKAANEFKKEMNQYVKRLAKMVNLDWHDGYMEQGEELQSYFLYLKKPAVCIYEYVMKQNAADYDKLNEILKNMAGSWDNIHAIPFRGGVELGDVEFDLELTQINETRKFYASPAELISFLWCLMLHGAAGNENVADDDIYRYIKDAVDNDADVLNGCEEDDFSGDNDKKEEEERDVIKEHECLQSGVIRLKHLFGLKETWNALPTTKKKHKMRRAIDRRYDGELHLRTRSYHLEDDYGWF
eukprot:131282_1